MGLIARAAARWYLYNLDTDDKIEGQFPPEDLRQELTVAWGETAAPNRQSAIKQFLHGNPERFSFRGMLFAETADVSIVRPLKLLLSWTKRDPDLFRPPVLHFWVGDSTVKLEQCVLESISSIEYVSFRPDKSPRQINFTINLSEYVPYSLEVEAGGETRYHRAREHDYYEWLTQREYGNPSLGIIIRDRHPTQGLLEAGDTVKLPSADTLRGLVPAATSIALRTAYGRKPTPQRDLRVSIFDRRDRTHTSHVVIEGTV